nr:helix-turn-helix transcriptional regulator [Streptomyces sp. SID12501]
MCSAGAELYERALRSGHVRGTDAAATPCLVDFGLLQPTVDDLDRLEPTSPVVALHQLLRGVADRIADERRREAQLTSVFEPFMRIGDASTSTDIPTIRVLHGVERINSAITLALADASSELLTIQPRTAHTGHHPERHAAALGRDQALLDRGGRIRTLYQHTLRHAPTVIARYEQLDGDAEARTLDEITDRLIIVDRAVAFIPDRTNQDVNAALEVRNPALVAYLVTVFQRLWQLAVPMYPQALQLPSLNGVTPRMRAIAALLVEGHTDAVIATRLGMNIRTARVHIAKLATTLGSDSRAQLGYLIGQSGILEQEQQPQGGQAEPLAPEG